MRAPFTIVEFSGSDPALAPYTNWMRANLKKSLRSGNKWYADIDGPIYFETYDKLITLLLAKSSVTVKLALVSEDLDTTLGFSILEGSVLHYAFVKSGIEARRKGIGKALLPKEPITQFTHLTRDGRLFWKAQFPRAKFNPFY